MDLGMYMHARLYVINTAQIVPTYVHMHHFVGEKSVLTLNYTVCKYFSNHLTVHVSNSNFCCAV
jgi:hypothetical protein